MFWFHFILFIFLFRYIHNRSIENQKFKNSNANYHALRTEVDQEKLTENKFIRPHQTVEMRFEIPDKGWMYSFLPMFSPFPA